MKVTRSSPLDSPFMRPVSKVAGVPFFVAENHRSGLLDSSYFSQIRVFS
ncbi:MAG: hypothetical protein IT223_06355 [Crocinitomicaceae bacterium]|nr:hypothetical protein [Crocinitomicaceae bacterium]